MMRKLLLFLIGWLMIGLSYALAQSKNVEMADVMRSNGKIYVVVGVLLMIFLGVIFYLVSIDRKINRIEKELDNK